VSQRRFRGKAIKTSFFGGDERVGPTRPMSNGFSALPYSGSQRENGDLAKNNGCSGNKCSVT